MNCGYFFSGLNKINSPEDLQKELLNIYEEDKKLCRNTIEIYLNIYKKEDMQKAIKDFKNNYNL